MKTNYEQKAKLFAYKAHDGVLRKDGVTPYIEHPKAVVGILRSVGIQDDVILSAAWLHDVVEDCDVSLETVRKEFGDSVANLVDGMTQRNDKNESDEEYHNRIISNNNDVRTIKLADVLHNMRSITSIPKKECRVKVYNSMRNSWTDYKVFAHEVCSDLSEMIEEAYQKASKQLEV
ncbi:HD domain-containing protein [Candidatus Woesearchaeota archaeon]|nr:HD domain-containing protein [Candidatus Woesearchaeota archaeon]